VHTPNLSKLLSAACLLALLFVNAAAQNPPGKPARALPARLGDFRAAGAKPLRDSGQFRPEDFAVASDQSQNYVGQDGRSFYVRAVKTRSGSAAYSLLSFFAGGENPARVVTIEGPGVLGIQEPSRLRFIKGATFVEIQDGVDVKGGGDAPRDASALRDFAKLFAEMLEGEAGTPPVLMMHLPDWEKKSEEGVGYAVTLRALQAAAGNRPVLDVLSQDFEDGTTEAVTAKYGDARLVVVEFATPQHSVESDARIAERIAQLRASGQPAPTQYRREGNYSVFVFDAPDAAAAERLISGVKYEKDVRWLGRNPHADEIAARHYTQTMGSMLLTTLITAGAAILTCLGVGGIIGGVIFLRRRAQSTEREVFSDAGGMLRLELEDLNTPSVGTKLIGRGED
jgi:hypothetical protein